jgi:glutaredoxin
LRQIKLASGHFVAMPENARPRFRIGNIACTRYAAPSPFFPNRGKKSVTHSIILYTREGCHLCEDAAALLARYELQFQCIDIDAEAALRERYNYCVPVVVIDGKERFRGRVNEVLLKRILAGSAADG